MKQLIGKTVCMCCLALWLAGCGEKKEDLPRFAVISDLHFGRAGASEKVPRALKNLLNRQPAIDALFIVGDLCNSGKQAEWSECLSVLNDASVIPANVAVYCMIAGIGHDMESREIAGQYYMDLLKQPAHQYIDLKGYPFITISGIGGTSSSGDYDTGARDYLAEKMADAARRYPGKPIFVFIHEPPLNTCYGSQTHEGWGTDFFLPALNPYPQAIVFSGHSHFPLADPRSIHQEVFTTVNDGSTTYSEVEPGLLGIGIHPENFERVTEGIIVNVLPCGDVEMERWDTWRNEEILPRWTVRSPHDGSRFTYKNRAGLPAPVFAANAQLTGRLENGTYLVAFPQASDNEAVHHYRLELLENDRVVYSFGKFSQFYLNSETPVELTERLTGLPYGKTLTPQVVAVDSYFNCSEPLKGEPFATPPYTPEVKARRPVAALLDVAFGKNGAKDISPQKNPVFPGPVAPETRPGEVSLQTAAVFTGDTVSYYAVDYQGCPEIEAAFAQGYTVETLYSPRQAGHFSPFGFLVAGGGAVIEQLPDGKLRYRMRIGGRTRTVNCPVTVQSGEYYHVVCTYEPGKAVMYVNGAKVGEWNGGTDKTTSLPLDGANRRITIGGNTSVHGMADLSLSGEVITVRMYNRPLRHDEAYLLYRDVK
ncbi:MAG: metallophosphoesterase [Tannerellaceae bacterium]|jgi:predicted phosphodiesterase|nr:metallophosphoesterase [Tannerellaceae bacterium]